MGKCSSIPGMSQLLPVQALVSIPPPGMKWTHSSDSGSHPYLLMSGWLLSLCDGVSGICVRQISAQEPSCMHICLPNTTSPVLEHVRHMPTKGGKVSVSARDALDASGSAEVQLGDLNARSLLW